MSRPLRFIPKDGIVEVTTRTLQGRLLLKPSPKLNDLILGVVGRAQERYGMVIHAFVFMSNHCHFLVRPCDAQQLSKFMQFVNSNVAREAARLHDWPEKFWSRRYRAIPVLDDETSFARIRYILSHGAKEGLVASSTAWPGASCVEALTRGKLLRGTWINRSEEFNARARGEKVRPSDHQTIHDIQLTPLPVLAGRTPDQCQAEFRRLMQEIRTEAVAVNKELGRTPIGAAKVLDQDPHHRPDSLDRSPAPFVHCKDRYQAIEFRFAYLAFVVGHCSATAHLHINAHQLTHVFPEGAFPPALPFVRAVGTSA